MYRSGPGHGDDHGCWLLIVLFAFYRCCGWLALDHSPTLLDE